MKPIYILIAVLTMLTIGCQNKNDFIGEPSESLMAYVLLEPSNYYGDGHYYHEVQSVDWVIEEGRSVQVLYGEVKSMGPLRRIDEKKFEIKNYIDSVKWVQKGHNQILNDSGFKEVVVLQLPIVEGNQWQFNTHTLDGTKVKVTGTLELIDETQNALMITYISNRGHQETRWLKKAMGTTSFTKRIDYKDVSTYSGYHFESFKNSVVEWTPFDELLPVAVESELYDLLDDFYASLLETLPDIKGVDYKIYETEQKEAGYLVLYVLEEWLLQSEDQMIYHVKYHIEWKDLVPSIKEVEAIDN